MIDISVWPGDVDGAIFIFIADQPYQIFHAISIDIIITDIGDSVLVPIAFKFLMKCPIKICLETNVCAIDRDRGLSFEIGTLIDKDIYCWHISPILKVGMGIDQW